MLNALIYFVTPKRKIAKAYIQALLNQQGYFWKKIPDELLERLSYEAWLYSKNVSEMSKLYSFSDVLSSTCRVFAYQLCDWLENKKQTEDVSENVKLILNRFDPQRIDAKTKK